MLNNLQAGTIYPIICTVEQRRVVIHFALNNSFASVALYDGI
jgi:hypothetical protein